ncbi:UNVERIFIED_CONTAM: hypothetical protein GTU68_010580 [Idotea baltica]|nr:hypothetical protein [Idotea baltica]
MEAGVLKRISGLSKSVIDKTRSLLSSEDQPATALIVPPEDHPVTTKVISRNALKVLNTIHEAGFAAYLVGGGVRDALVGLKPKDFDVATDASPEELRELFKRNSRIIGRRFRLVHVLYGRDIIEVATFRASHDKGAGGEIGEAGRIVRDNVFGSIEEDALRRDFSVNALYYNIADNSIVDYAGGLSDIEAGVFRLIGDPVTRCEEDPVRVLRAVRLSSKLEFDIEPKTLAAMQQTASELGKTAPARMFEEVLKLFQGGYAKRSFAAVREHDLLQYLFPLLAKRLDNNPSPDLMKMLNAALANTDKRVSQGKPITPAYLLAFMLWPDVEERTLARVDGGMSLSESLMTASDEVLKQQIAVISIPKRFSGPMREIWQLQPRLEQFRGKRALKLMEGRRFRAAYDFLCLRSSIEPRLKPMAKWWTEVQELQEDERLDFISKKPAIHGLWGEPKAESANKKKRRRRRPKQAKKPSGD